MKISSSPARLLWFPCLTSAGWLVALLLRCGAGLHAADAPDPLRITREVEPVAQAVELVVDPARDDFSGRVRIDVVAHAATTTFRLHALGPVFDTASLADLAGRTIALKAAVTEAELGIVTLTADASIPPGAYTLTISFANKFNRAGLGLYKTVSRGDAYLFTQFEDRHARKAFPCWDDPGFKIPWQLTVTIPAALAAVGNSPIAQETTAAATKTVAFGRTPPMPSYLVALAVGPLEFTPVPGLSVPGRIVTPRGQSALAGEAARVSPALLSHLEAYFGVPYPFAKLDQVGVPEYIYGAMENAGCITYRDSLLLLDPARPSFASRRNLANVAAHEMAHMWFGDLVTMAWWDDLWLNESFADWMCAKIVEQTHPEYRIYLQQLGSIHTAMRLDALPSVKPVRRRLTARDDPALVLDALTYSKGKSILRMVESWIGPENFRAALHAYFEKHRWGNTTAEDLWAAFDRASGENISAMLSAFIEKPGIPFVTLSVVPGGKLQLSQRRFANLGETPAAGRWQVPVVLVWSGGGRIHRERILLKDETQLLEIPGLAGADWIYPNAGETGYYRWSMPPEFNARLARHAAGLTVLERLGLLENASALLNAGELAGGDYLAYVSAFATDPEPEIVLKVSNMLRGVDQTFVGPAQRARFNALRTALLRPALTRIGVRPQPGEPEHVAPLRADLLAALGEDIADPEVVAFSREFARQFLQSPGSVDSSLAGAALGVTAYHGDAALFEALDTALQNSPTPAARRNLIAALGAFHDPALARRALAYALTDRLNSTEFLTPVFGVAGDRELTPLAVDWTMANFDAIKAKAPPMFVANLIQTGGNADSARFEKLRAFLLDPARTSQMAERTIRDETERLTLRTRLREKEQANIDAYLATYPGAALSERAK